MSPILIRPVREQIEHDRIVRLLQARFRRRFEVGVNVGTDQAAPVKTGRQVLYPDLVLTHPGRTRKLAGVVEVETTESVNNLEAMAQWAHFARLKAPFSLYVPAGSVGMARRLCTDHAIGVQEIWSYHTVAGQTRFALVHRAPEPPPTRPARPARKAGAARAKKRARPAGRTRAAGARGRPATSTRRARTASSRSRSRTRKR